MFFALRSAFWLGLVFYAIGVRDGASENLAVDQASQIIAHAARLCAADPALCAAPLAGAGMAKQPTKGRHRLAVAPAPQKLALASRPAI